MTIKAWLSEKLTSRRSRVRLSEFLAAHATNSDLVLDLGSKGRPFSHLFPNAIALDLEFSPELSLLGDAHRLPFKNTSFELIVCSEVLEHLEKPWLAVADMHRILKPGGSVILTTRFMFPIHGNPGDFFRYTPYGLRSLFSEWEIVSLSEEATGLEAMGILFHRMGFQSLTTPKFLRYLFFALGTFIASLNFIMVKGKFENSIICTGYYLVAKKKTT